MTELSDYQRLVEKPMIAAHIKREGDLVQQVQRLRAAAIPVVASSHLLQDGQHDTPEGYVNVDKKALLALAAIINPNLSR